MAERKRRRQVDLEARRSGILMHITSLPGPHFNGDLGGTAYDFVDFLAAAGQSWWQVLPINPIGKGNSPYSTVSSFAGEPLLIGLDKLVNRRLLDESEIPRPAASSETRVDYDLAVEMREPLLRLAFTRFKADTTQVRGAAFKRFRTENAFWLPDYALFSTLAARFADNDWTRWPKDLRERKPSALEGARRELADEVLYREFLQFEFFRQWQALKEYAACQGVALMGDLPIFVAHESADCWAHQRFFLLRRDGRPSVVAGVPPDNFSADGQLWGNALYRWPELKKDGFKWWIERVRQLLKSFDAVRIDHFIGFTRYWEIPGDATTARRGRWVKAPGREFFAKLKKALGDLPLIAEDLGVVTQDVWDLRDGFAMPGMRVMQFAFGDDKGAEHHRPHQHTINSVVYTGTHDNMTAVGWWNDVRARVERQGQNPPPYEYTFALRYLGSDGRDLPRDLIRATMASVAKLAILPMQDALGLGAEARMNFPGIPEGNWQWRMDPRLVTPELTRGLRVLTEVFSRI